MANGTARELCKRSGKLFEIQSPWLNFWQELARNYYPQRADFTGEIPWGTEFGSELFDSAPVTQRRDLANGVAGMLRPRGQTWFKPKDGDDKVMKLRGVADWFDMAGNVQSRWMYRSGSKFVGSTKMADHDFVTFGNAVLSGEVNRKNTGLSFNNYHLRDCAWAENADGDVDQLARKFKWSARQAKQRFGEKAVHLDIRNACEKDPEKQFPLQHFMLPIDDYEYVDAKKARQFRKMPFVSVYMDLEHEEIISEAGSFDFRYIVARWQRISGSAYAFSPATADTLADARQLQVMGRTSNEALEKSVDPPVSATEEAIRGDINLFAGGITWKDKSYDEKLGKTIELLDVGKNALLALNAIDAARARLANGTYVNKLTMPIDGRDKTAFETQKIIEEYIRGAMPVIEPWEADYSTPVLDQVFGTLLRVGAFGPPQEMPDALSAREFEWEFINPLQETKQKVKVQTYSTAVALAKSSDFAPSVVNRVNWDTAYADAVRGAGAPEEWMVDEVVADKMTQQQQQIVGLQKTIQGMTAAGQAAGTIADGASKLGAVINGNSQAVPS